LRDLGGGCRALQPAQKHNRPLSDADRLRLNDLEKEVARLKMEKKGWQKP
jgi:hypothetical protein